MDELAIAGILWLARTGTDPINTSRARTKMAVNARIMFFRKIQILSDAADLLRLIRSTSRNTRSRFPPRILWMSSDE